MPRLPQNMSDSELALFRLESERKKKISLARAKQRYRASEKGKACDKRYYEKNRTMLVNNLRKSRKTHKVMEEFFLSHAKDHPGFFEEKHADFLESNPHLMIN